MMMSAGFPRILALWSAPRCRSTVFFRMMVERGDFTAIHEPFSYLAEFGASTIGERTARTEAELIAEIRALSSAGPVFFKDTTDERYPGVLADRTLLRSDATHTFIIRHPAETIASYCALNADVRRDQIGFAGLYELFAAVADEAGEAPAVIDAADLVSAPRELVAAYCDRVSIPFVAEALTWAAGERREWQPSRRWHREVSRSTGFERPAQPCRSDLTTDPRLSHYLEFHLPYYEKLREHRLVVAGRG